MKKRAKRYGTKKAPPPYSKTSEGKRHTFPKPTCGEAEERRGEGRMRTRDYEDDAPHDDARAFLPP